MNKHFAAGLADLLALLLILGGAGAVASGSGPTVDGRASPAAARLRRAAEVRLKLDQSRPL